MKLNSYMSRRPGVHIWPPRLAQWPPGGFVRGRHHNSQLPYAKPCIAMWPQALVVWPRPHALLPAW